jgi:hypothetical protein
MMTIRFSEVEGSRMERARQTLSEGMIWRAFSGVSRRGERRGAIWFSK